MGAKRNIAVICWLLAGVFIACILTGQINGSPSEAMIPTLVLVAAGVFFYTWGAKPKDKSRKAQGGSGGVSDLYGKHAGGLPLAPGADCGITCVNGRLAIKGGGNTINLSLDKVTDVSIQSEAEIRKQYVSSVGGAVAGAVLFGPVGAVIGGRAKQKQTRTVTSYLVITYLKDDQVSVIFFQIFDFLRARKLVNAVQENKGRAGGATINL